MAKKFKKEKNSFFPDWKQICKAFFVLSVAFGNIFVNPKDIIPKMGLQT